MPVYTRDRPLSQGFVDIDFYGCLIYPGKNRHITGLVLMVIGFEKIYKIFDKKLDKY